jgi:hypothetical protein
MSKREQQVWNAIAGALMVAAVIGAALAVMV